MPQSGHVARGFVAAKARVCGRWNGYGRQQFPAKRWGEPHVTGDASDVRPAKLAASSSTVGLLGGGARSLFDGDGAGAGDSKAAPAVPNGAFRYRRFRD